MVLAEAVNSASDGPPQPAKTNTMVAMQVPRVV
jgi:hypothetical protein